MIRSHYDNLQVARTASDTVIRAAYKGLAQKYHPDRFDGDPAVAERIMKLLNEAYAVLSDPARRKEHDLWLDEQQRLKDKKTSNEAHATTDAAQPRDAELDVEKYGKEAATLARFGSSEKAFIRSLMYSGCSEQAAKELAVRYKRTGTSSRLEEAFGAMLFWVMKPVPASLLFAFVLLEKGGRLKAYSNYEALGVVLGVAFGLWAFSWVVWFVISRFNPELTKRGKNKTLTTILGVCAVLLMAGNW